MSSNKTGTDNIVTKAAILSGEQYVAIPGETRYQVGPDLFARMREDSVALTRKFYESMLPDEDAADQNKVLSGVNMQAALVSEVINGKGEAVPDFDWEAASVTVVRRLVNDFFRIVVPGGRELLRYLNGLKNENGSQTEDSVSQSQTNPSGS